VVSNVVDSSMAGSRWRALHARRPRGGVAPPRPISPRSWLSSSWPSSWPRHAARAPPGDRVAHGPAARPADTLEAVLERTKDVAEVAQSSPTARTSSISAATSGTRSPRRGPQGEGDLLRPRRGLRRRGAQARPHRLIEPGTVVVGVATRNCLWRRCARTSKRSAAGERRSSSSATTATSGPPISPTTCCGCPPSTRCWPVVDALPLQFLAYCWPRPAATTSTVRGTWPRPSRSSSEPARRQPESATGAPRPVRSTGKSAR